MFASPASVNNGSHYQAEGYAEHWSPPPFDEQELTEQQSERSTQGDADTGA